MAHSTRTMTVIDNDLVALQQLAPGSTVALFVTDASQQALVVDQVIGPASVRLADLTIDIGYHVSGWVAANWVPMVNADAQLDLDVHAEELRFALAMPLLLDHRLMGVLTIYGAEPFTDRVLQRVELLMPLLAAHQAENSGDSSTWAPGVGPQAGHSNSAARW
jgi:hypothetical protein